MTMWDVQTVLALPVLVLLGFAALAALAARTTDKALLGLLAVFAAVALTALALGQTAAAMPIAAVLGVLALALIGARALLGEGSEADGPNAAWQILIALPLLAAIAALFAALPPAESAEGLQAEAAPIWPLAAPLALSGLAVAALLGLGERAVMDQPVAPAPPPKTTAPILARAAKAALPPLMLFAVHLHVASALSPTGAIAGAALLAGGAGLYALVFGLGAALAVLRPVLLRALAALGLLVAGSGELAAFVAPSWAESARAGASAGASLAVFAGLTLCIFAVLGRARRIEAAGP